ncbi:hypothetical protein RLEG12_00395 (plasmid) [Rhizobium leguminosarum bv. trifolii CB782]|nr:hypothetical protein RLEG12_00395 [Rhizobium leguminosarum bv. trifolii CB782]
MKTLKVEAVYPMAFAFNHTKRGDRPPRYY